MYTTVPREGKVHGREASDFTEDFTQLRTIDIHIPGNYRLVLYVEYIVGCP